MAIKSRPKYTSKGGLGGKFTSGKKLDVSYFDTLLNKWKAYSHGKKAYVTIPNPNGAETNKRFIRVEMKTLFGDPRGRNSYVVIQ
jgi:hypothetical protein